MSIHRPILCPHGKATAWTGFSTPGEPLPAIEHCEQCNPDAVALPSPLGWWSISGEALLDMLREVQAGADPDLVYAEHYANSTHEHVEGNQ